MNPETLETLLIDRALGRHSPEVEALLAEHLATNPKAAEAAVELNDVIALAAVALRRPGAKVEPPPRLEGLFWLHRANRVFALAASFVAGAGIALLVMRDLGPHSETPQVARVLPPPPVWRHCKRPE